MRGSQFARLSACETLNLRLTSIRSKAKIESLSSRVIKQVHFTRLRSYNFAHFSRTNIYSIACQKADSWHLLASNRCISESVTRLRSSTFCCSIGLQKRKLFKVLVLSTFKLKVLTPVLPISFGFKKLTEPATMNKEFT